MLGAMKWILAQFLSATTIPSVARVSAPSTIPSWGEEKEGSGYTWARNPRAILLESRQLLGLTLYTTPAMVVPVLRAVGSRRPFWAPSASSWAFLQRERSHIKISYCQHSP